MINLIIRFVQRIITENIHIWDKKKKKKKKKKNT